MSVDPQRVGFIDGIVARNVLLPLCLVLLLLGSHLHVIVQFLSQSGLAMNDLGAIYNLADIDRDGRLSQAEFFVAMKLIRGRQAGTLK